MVYRRCGTGWATGASAPSYRRTTGLPSAQWHSPETGNTFCHPARWDTRYYIRPQQSIAICLICLYARTRWWSCGSCPRRGVWSPTRGRARRASRSTRPRPCSTTPRTTSCSPTRPPPPSAAGTPGNTQSNLSRLPFDYLSTYLFTPQEREPEAAAVPGPQRQREVDGALTHPGSLPLLLGRLQVRLLTFSLKIVFVWIS